MFLFKNIKNRVLRIALYATFYGFLCDCLFVFLGVIVPDSLSGFIEFLMAVSSFLCIIGAVISIVSFFFGIIFSKKRKNKPNSKKEAVEERQQCSRCGCAVPKIETFNGRPCCYSCYSYYSSKLNVIDGKLADKKSGASLLNEIVLLVKPLNTCIGEAEPTDFVINIFADKVEIIWGVGWRGGTSHADGADGMEILEADYFETHTVDDFVAYLNGTYWGKDFVKWFCIKDNSKITSLFSSTKHNQAIVGTFGNDVITIKDGKIFLNTEHVSFTQVQVAETQHWGKTVYADYINGKYNSLEEAYKSKFKQNSKGQWILKKYSIDEYRCLLTDPNDKNSIGAVALKPWSVTLYSRRSLYEGYKVFLSFSIEGAVSVIESASFNGGKNGGGKEIKLPDDYFTQNTIDEFLDYLFDNLINNDWIHTESRHIKDNIYMKKLFNEKEKAYICARCSKKITDEESIWIGNHRFCSECAKPIKAPSATILSANKKEKQHTASLYAKEYAAKRTAQERLNDDKIRSSIKEQLDELAAITDETNDEIGEIYVSNLFLDCSDSEFNSAFLSDLLGGATLVKHFGGGIDACEFCWQFAKDNLLIELSGTSIRGGPILVGGAYKVYRCDEGKSSADFE